MHEYVHAKRAKEGGVEQDPGTVHLDGDTDDIKAGKLRAHAEMHVNDMKLMCKTAKKAAEVPPPMIDIYPPGGPLSSAPIPLAGIRCAEIERVRKFLLTAEFKVFTDEEFFMIYIEQLKNGNNCSNPSNPAQLDICTKICALELLDTSRPTDCPCTE